MAIPQTAVQIEMMQRAFAKNLDGFRERVLIPYQSSLLEMLCRRVIRRRPHTDDMMQMLLDLGIEPPEQNLISPDGITIRLR